MASQLKTTLALALALAPALALTRLSSPNPDHSPPTSHPNPSQVASQLKTFPLKTLDFERRRASLLDALANLEMRQPVSLASYYRGLALETPRYSVEQLRVAAAAASLEKLADFQARSREAASQLGSTAPRARARGRTRQLPGYHPSPGEPAARGRARGPRLRQPQGGRGAQAAP